MGRLVTGGVPTHWTVAALVAAGIVVAFMWITLRAINTGQQDRCTTANACVDAINTPYVMRRL